LITKDSIEKSLNMVKDFNKTSKFHEIKCIMVEIATLFETPSARGFPTTVQELLRSSQPERIEIDFEKYGHDHEDRIVEDLIKENSNKIVFVLVGVPPLSEVKEQFTSSKFDRYI
jgi:hypothetical protein